MSLPAVASLPAAQRTLIDAAVPVGTERIASAAALGRILATEITTPRPFPDTRRSAVDGYALGRTGLDNYRIVETLGAAELPRKELTPELAAAVMTGATVPEGSVAVVRVEDVEVDGTVLTLNKTIAAGDNINRIGDETNEGQVILGAGTRLSPVAHSVLCCTGIAEVDVYRLPRVGLLITGDEVLQLGQEHRPGRVYDSNRHFLAGGLAELGIRCQVLGPVRDDEATIRASLERLAEECDLVVSSGGVSMGKYDFIRPLLHSGGYQVIVNRTAVKPGRPLIVARKGTTLFFGMPGYPAACLVNFYYYLLPTIKTMMGIGEALPRTRSVVLGQDLRGGRGRWDAIRVRLERRDGCERAFALDSQLTSHFLNYGACDGLVTLDDETVRVAAGEPVDLLEFRMQ